MIRTPVSIDSVFTVIAVAIAVLCSASALFASSMQLHMRSTPDLELVLPNAAAILDQRLVGSLAAKPNRQVLVDLALAPEIEARELVGLDAAPVLAFASVAELGLLAWHGGTVRKAENRVNGFP